ncbi:MAG: hypothetical protein AAFU53_03680 [Cyanobacteria bacterium J06632_3]
MSLIVLLITVVVAFLFSLGIDTLPGILWGWLNFPTWLFWGVLLILIAWCIEDRSPV